MNWITFIQLPFLNTFKDFGDMIPGHGGIMDRFDCQFLMATFVNVYISSFIRVASPQKLLSQVSQFEMLIELITNWLINLICVFNRFTAWNQNNNCNCFISLRKIFKIGIFWTSAKFINDWLIGYVKIKGFFTNGRKAKQFIFF